MQIFVFIVILVLFYSVMQSVVLGLCPRGNDASWSSQERLWQAIKESRIRFPSDSSVIECLHSLLDETSNRGPVDMSFTLTTLKADGSKKGCICTCLSLFPIFHGNMGLLVLGSYQTTSTQSLINIIINTS